MVLQTLKGSAVYFAHHASEHFWKNQVIYNPVDNFGTVVGENPTPYGILALWAVNGYTI